MAHRTVGERLAWLRSRSELTLEEVAVWLKKQFRLEVSLKYLLELETGKLPRDIWLAAELAHRAASHHGISPMNPNHWLLGVGRFMETNQTRLHMSRMENRIQAIPQQVADNQHFQVLRALSTLYRNRVSGCVVNADWLLTGRGEPFLAEAASVQVLLGDLVSQLDGSLEAVRPVETQAEARMA